MSENANNTDRHEAKERELVSRIEETPEEIKGELAEVQATIIEKLVEVHTFIGPIPPPDILQGYDKVLPGLADRIAGMAEAEDNH